VATKPSGRRRIWRAANPRRCCQLERRAGGGELFCGQFRWQAGEGNRVLQERGGHVFSQFTLEEAGGKFKPTALQKIALPQPARQLLVADNEGKSRLIAIFGTNEPAQLLDFDGAKPPVLVQTLAGTTNKVLNSASRCRMLSCCSHR
jgi:hypothetical protein